MSHVSEKFQERGIKNILTSFGRTPRDLGQVKTTLANFRKHFANIFQKKLSF